MTKHGILAVAAFVTAALCSNALTIQAIVDATAGEPKRWAWLTLGGVLVGTLLYPVAVWQIGKHSQARWNRTGRKYYLYVGRAATAVIALNLVAISSGTFWGGVVWMREIPHLQWSVLRLFWSTLWT